MKKIWKFIKKVFGYGELKENHLLKEGFTKMSKKGPVLYYYKGDYTLKWNTGERYKTISIRLGNNMRFFSGMMETPHDLKFALNKVMI